ncbi:AraC family transcriptional regulator [Candidatus Amarolinea dominans]|uniref:AraC family transcriptional regulator n=1 Tax=Candidatus Amarolinea dominans TaxID=3140696 RepID=UPI0031CC728B
MSAAITIDSRDIAQAPSAGARMQTSQHELIKCIKRTVGADGTVEPLPGLSIHRSSAPGEPLHSVYDPVFCVIAQGSKEVFLGSERYLYDAAHYLIVTASLPVAARARSIAGAPPT